MREEYFIYHMGRRGFGGRVDGIVIGIGIGIGAAEGETEGT